MTKLDNDLRAAARTVNLPPGDLDAVMGRGATLARRKHRIVAGGLTIALLGATAGVYATFNRNKPVPLQTIPGDARRGDVPIRWEKVNSASGLGYTMTMSEEALYAVATAPGRGSPNDTRRVLWTSTDGVDWSTVGELKNDLYIANLADRGGRLYGVGTGPAAAAVTGRKPVPDLVIGASDDGGRNWNRQALPIDMRAISAKSRSVSVYAVDVATTRNAVLAIGAVSADLDVPAVLPPGQSAPHGWAITDTGVDVLGDGPECPSGTSSAPPGAEDKRAAVEANSNKNGRQYTHDCYKSDGTHESVTPQDSQGVTASYTFDQLQVTGDLLRAVRVEPMVFRAETGSLNFERVASDTVSQLDGPGMLERDGDGLIIVGQHRQPADANRDHAPEPMVLRSTDGKTWTTSAPPTGLGWAQAIGQLNGRTTLIGDTYSGSNPSMWVSDGNGGWSSMSLSSAIDPAVTDRSQLGLLAAGVGRLGAVAVVSVMKDAIADRGGVTLQNKGYTLHITNDRWNAFVTDATGKEVAKVDSLLDPQSSGFLHVDMRRGATLVDANGGTLATFSMDDIRNVTGGALRGSRAAQEIKFRVLASRDGVTWSDQDVNDLAGQDISGVIRVLMTGEKAIIALTPKAPANSDAALKQIDLVGTPL